LSCIGMSNSRWGCMRRTDFTLQCARLLLLPLESSHVLRLPGVSSCLQCTRILLMTRDTVRLSLLQDTAVLARLHRSSFCSTWSKTKSCSCSS
jgi:hypothetical protein